MALIGFTKTLAQEGAKYVIKSTAIAPIAASPMTETIMPPEMLANLSASPFVAVLCHPDRPDASGKVFKLDAGFIAKTRWERSNGTVFKTDSSFTPSAVKAKWSEITDFSNRYSEPSFQLVHCRITYCLLQGKLEQAAKLPPNTQSSPEVRFDSQTVIITGLGVNVVVNDVSEKGANAVVDEVIKGSCCSVLAEDGEVIVKVALEKFGSVHVFIANAGILRDKSFTAMTEQEWDIVSYCRHATKEDDGKHGERMEAQWKEKSAALSVVREGRPPITFHVVDAHDCDGRQVSLPDTRPPASSLRPRVPLPHHHWLAGSHALHLRTRQTAAGDGTNKPGFPVTNEYWRVLMYEWGSCSLGLGLDRKAIEQ
ncbi:hypothetical protein D9615_008778 [Tricholomella constricta]|uniref:Uncharacterized protein n=1 Tax=Tricholomella constricta TaxID=117010 RepID=A0A8H5H7T8_9AGAR|nr:hypothetical protein D9615_008778 [Tricholomella constricta]